MSGKSPSVNRMQRRASVLDKRVAVVTGAASGIGKAIMERLLRDGVSVLAVDKDETALKVLQQQHKTYDHTRLECHPCNLRDTEQLRQVFFQLEQLFGRLDICVNCAGLSHYSSALTGDFHEWEEMMQVNVLAVAQCSRESIRIMRKCGLDSGHIINISSNFANHGPPRDHGYLRFYSATKHALRSLTDSLRDELRETKSGIRVTAITPALVRTDFMDTLLRDHPDQLKDYYREHAALQPEDVADAVIYALSAPAHVEISEIRLNPISVVKECSTGDVGECDAD